MIRRRQNERNSEVTLTNYERMLYAENFVYSSIEDLLNAEATGSVTRISFEISEETYYLVKALKKEIEEISRKEKIIITLDDSHEGYYMAIVKRKKNNLKLNK